VIIKRVSIAAARKMFAAPRRRPRHEEDNLQEACVLWFRLEFPNRLIFAIPNGGKRNPFEGKRLKRQGVTAGVPDLVIPEPSRGFHGLWIEMKTERGWVNHDQKNIISALRKRNYETRVCRSLEGFQITVKDYFYGVAA